MSRTDRRTFLASGLKSSVVVTTAGFVVDRTDESLEHHVAWTASSTIREEAAGRISARAFTVNGIVDPLGVDPDDCSFAWVLTSPGRDVRQRGYRIRVQRDDPGLDSLMWDSGAVPSARQAFVAYGGTPLDGDAMYRWSLQVQDPAGNWSAPYPAGRFLTSLRQDDWTAQWLHPAASSVQPNQVTYVRTVVTPPAGPLTRATAYVAAAHKYLLFVDGEQVGAGPSFSYPDEQYSESDRRDRRTAAPAAPTRSACCTTGTDRRPGPAGVGARAPARPDHAALRERRRY